MVSFMKLSDRFGEAYAAKNIMRQIAISFATGLTPVWLEREAAQSRGGLLPYITLARPNVAQWMQAAVDACHPTKTVTRLLGYTFARVSL